MSSINIIFSITTLKPVLKILSTFYWHIDLKEAIQLHLNILQHKCPVCQSTIFTV